MIARVIRRCRIVGLTDRWRETAAGELGPPPSRGLAPLLERLPGEPPLPVVLEGWNSPLLRQPPEIPLLHGEKRRGLLDVHDVLGQDHARTPFSNGIRPDYNPGISVSRAAFLRGSTWASRCWSRPRRHPT